jgi:hypothetical protein
VDIMRANLTTDDAKAHQTARAQRNHADLLLVSEATEARTRLTGTPPGWPGR